jgi:hypothetical protein
VPQLSVLEITAAGVAQTFGAASASDTFVNDGRTVVFAKTSGSASTLTVVSQQYCNQGVQHNLSVSMEATETKMIGPFSKERFNNSSGLATIQASSTTGLTYSIVKI